MKYWALAFLAFGLGMLMLVVAGNVDRVRDRAEAAQRESVWKARYAEAATKSDAVRDTVIREVTKTKTLRDSILLYVHDTARIQEFVYRVDTLVVQCEKCAAQLRSLRVVSDSLLASKDLRIASLTPSKWDRVRPYVIGGAAFWLGTKFQK